MRVSEPDEVSQKPPGEVCLDIVLKWSESLGVPGTAKVLGPTLMVCAVNHRKELAILSVPLSEEPPRIGRDPRWNLVRLGPTVWKLTPSILHDRIHGYVTIVGVPEPAPWLTAIAPPEVIRSPCTLENCGHMRQLDAIVDLLGMARGTRSVLDELRARERAAWEDQSDEWTAAIRAAHPARSGESHTEYGIAMRMVGHRHSKWALIALVSWLLGLIARGAKLPDSADGEDR